MPPCQPASPVPASTAARKPAVCAASIVDMVMACTMRSVAASSAASA